MECMKMLHDFYDKRYLILNMIHHLGPISRIELINMTDFVRPAWGNYKGTFR